MPISPSSIPTAQEAQTAPIVAQSIHKLEEFGNVVEGRVYALERHVTTPSTAAVPLTQTQLNQIAKALSAVGSNPLTITNLPGSSTGSLTVGPHAQRVLTSPGPNQNFYEIDRHALYAAQANAWVLVGSCPEMEISGVGSLPSDLGGNDAAFYAFDQQTGMTWLWSGATWHWHKGIQYGLYASRPTAFVGCDAGVIYVATDRGYQSWELDYGAGAWVLIRGWGRPQPGVLSAIPTLTVNDTGYDFYASDYDRTWTWAGAAWVDAPGQPSRGMVVNFQSGVPPGTGWSICDGTNATFSTASGGTAVIAKPNLIGQFIHENSTSGGTGAAVNINYQIGATNATDVLYTDMIPFVRL
jgi:hypothetical protein